jgi:hypothetical protein
MRMGEQQWPHLPRCFSQGLGDATKIVMFLTLSHVTEARSPRFTVNQGVAPYDNIYSPGLLPLLPLSCGSS